MRTKGINQFFNIFSWRWRIAADLILKDKFASSFLSEWSNTWLASGMYCLDYDMWKYCAYLPKIKVKLTYGRLLSIFLQPQMDCCNATQLSKSTKTNDSMSQRYLNECMITNFILQWPLARICPTLMSFLHCLHLFLHYHDFIYTLSN